MPYQEYFRENRMNRQPIRSARLQRWIAAAALCASSGPAFTQTTYSSPYPQQAPAQTYQQQPAYQEQPGYQQQPAYQQQPGYGPAPGFAQQPATGYQQQPAPGYAQPGMYPPALPEYRHGQYPQQVVSPRPMCFECGMVESMREVEKKGDGTGLGAVAGGLTGLIVGKQLGNGRGQNVGAVLGAAGGAFAGHQIEKNTRSTKTYEVNVRMEDGGFRTVASAVAPTWRTGERVRIVNGVLQPDMR